MKFKTCWSSKTNKQMKHLEAPVHRICIKKRRGETEPSFQATVSPPPLDIPCRLHAVSQTLELHCLFISLILPGKCSGEGGEKRQKYSKISQQSNIPWNSPDSEDCLPKMSNFFKSLLDSRLCQGLVYQHIWIYKGILFWISPLNTSSSLCP